MIGSQKGQAVLETLLSFPMVAAVVTAVTVGIYLNTCHYLTDFWTQEAALCLAKTRAKKICLGEFKEKTQSLAFTNIRVLSFHRSSRLVFVKVKATWPTQNFQTYAYKLPWPVQKL